MPMPLPMPSANFITILVVMAVSGVVAFFGLIDSNLTVFTFVVAGWVASVCLHEFGHAVVARLGGDHTVERQGYLELDPARYMDPIGSIVFPVVMLALGAIGLPGGAVFVRSDLLRDKRWQSLVALAGPFASLVFLVIVALPFALGLDRLGGQPLFWAALGMLAYLQATAIIFNLLPIPGFDGYGAIEPYLPAQFRAVADQLRPWTFFAVLILLFAVPDFGYAIFRASLYLTDVLAVDHGAIGQGLSRFRFWKTFL